MLMRKRSNKDLCPRYPGRQRKQMSTFKGNKFDIVSAGVCFPKSRIYENGGKLNFVQKTSFQWLKGRNDDVLAFQFSRNFLLLF